MPQLAAMDAPMDLFCLLVGGMLRATLPGPELAVEWQHSVAKTLWEERYRIDGDRLLLADACVKGTGAGMEPPPDAVRRADAWCWQPRRALPELALTWSTHTADYRLCAQGTCKTLGEWIGPVDDGTVVVVRPCNAAAKR
jgi:hypothetical protein